MKDEAKIKKSETTDSKVILSTDLFKDKNIPPFLKEHTLFKNPTKVKKVFRNVGLPNFIDKTIIDKPFENVKKEGSYVFNLMAIMADAVAQARDASFNMADTIQYLYSKEDRATNKIRMNDLYLFSDIMKRLHTYMDPYDGNVINGSVVSADGKIVLKLIGDIVDDKGKNVFRKGEPLLRIMNAIKDKCGAFGIPFINLEQTTQFKVFSKENMPNKEYSVIFSSEGKEGAWDIATMSMRGIKSCQRWDGEYPRCLVGSILSRFVGIIYLTSGVKSEDHPSYSNLGTKMIRRCVVRYAIDADEKSPCILIDKMYPEYDKEVCTIFTKSLQSRTKLPVYYAPELGNKIRHIYSPPEKIRDQISNRDWSYQDTPLKSRHDLNVFYFLNNNKEEIERNVKSFRVGLPLFFAKKMEDIYDGNLIVDDEIQKTIKNIRMNTPFTPLCENIVLHMLTNIPQTDSKGFTDSKSYYRRYLMDLMMNRRKAFPRVLANVKAIVSANTSRTVNMETFTEFLYSTMTEFIKLELAKVIN
jgi:hypothetical protein